MFRREEQAEPERVWGLVTALDVDGVVTIWRNTHRFQVQVTEEQVFDFTLGERAHLEVTGTAHVDRVGLRGNKVDYDFIRTLPLDEALDYGDDSGLP